MATNKMRLTYRGAMKCYLIFCTIVDCGCRTCDTYGMIPLDRSEKSIMFDICWDHQMMMNLIPWSDLETASVRDLDLYVCGWKQNTKWLDSVVVAGKMCKISVEIFCPIKWAPVVYQQCYARHQHYHHQHHHHQHHCQQQKLPQQQPPQQYKPFYYQQQPPQQYKSLYYQQQPPRQYMSLYHQQQPPQQYSSLYYQQQPPQQQKSHLRRMSSVATSVLGEVVKEKLLEAAFELTIDLGVQFFLGC
ncbi:hypothetical protein BGX24_010829 [Mortierella sp. AD032]|nr:hypothetical protein BGX24_010829 [Mortierella sp. AD032]